jgi:hypothetical protein
MVKRRGETPDTSDFLHFKFYEKVYYHDPYQKYQGTKEKPGYWLGVADHVGDRLCFHILTTDTHSIIERNVVRSAERSPTNVTLTFPIDEMHPTPVETEPDDNVISIVNDEIQVERGEHDEREAIDETDLPTTDDHSAATNVQYNCSAEPNRNRPTPHAYTFALTSQATTAPTPTTPLWLYGPNQTYGTEYCNDAHTFPRSAYCETSVTRYPRLL